MIYYSWKNDEDKKDGEGEGERTCQKDLFSTISLFGIVFIYIVVYFYNLCLFNPWLP